MAWTEKDESRMNKDVKEALKRERFITAILAGEKVKLEYVDGAFYVFRYNGTYCFADVLLDDFEYRAYDYIILYSMGFNTAEDAKKALELYEDDMEAYYETYKEHIPNEMGVDAFHDIAKYTSSLIAAFKANKSRLAAIA